MSQIENDQHEICFVSVFFASLYRHFYGLYGFLKTWRKVGANSNKNKTKTHTPGPGLPEDIIKHVKHILADPSGKLPSWTYPKSK